MAKSRAISWVGAARKAFATFPETVQADVLSALAIAAQGRKADSVKPLHGLGSGVFEVALRHRGDAWRVVYAVQIGADVWVVHAFQKKSTKGIATPAHEIELVASRIRRLREMLK